jgi:nucleotide-binding universal stress UspA family protein
MRKAMKVLLAVDGSEYGLTAVEEAARMPWPEGSMVRIISISELPTTVLAWGMPMSTGTVEEWEKIFEDRSGENVARAMARFSQIASAQIEVTSKTLKGDPKRVILDEAEHWQADLIVVGTHGYSTLERIWLGSVSRAIASHAECAIRIVRRRNAPVEPGKGMKILLAVDGSKFSDATVEEVATRPWPQGSEIRVLSALHLQFAPTPEVWALPNGYYARVEETMREQGESAVGYAASRLRDSNTERAGTSLTVTTEVIAGHAEEIIIEVAKKWEADLIVLGSHGHSGLGRFLLGSVSQAVASHAPCSVEIVRKNITSEAAK